MSVAIGIISPARVLASLNLKEPDLLSSDTEKLSGRDALVPSLKTKAVERSISTREAVLIPF